MYGAHEKRKKKLNLYHSTCIMDEREKGNSTPNWGNGGSHSAHRVSLALTMIKMPTLPFLLRVVVVVYVYFYMSVSYHSATLFCFCRSFMEFG